jgi:hypothetical protein
MWPYMFAKCCCGYTCSGANLWYLLPFSFPHYVTICATCYVYYACFIMDESHFAPSPLPQPSPTLQYDLRGTIKENSWPGHVSNPAPLHGFWHRPRLPTSILGPPILTKFCFDTERWDRLYKTPDSYSWGHGYKSRPEDRHFIQTIQENSVVVRQAKPWPFLAYVPYFEK